MDKGPLVGEQIRAGAKLAREFSAQYKPLKAAFWLKKTEESQWDLYLVPDQAETPDPTANAAVARLLDPDTDLWLSMLEVRIVRPDHPLAKAVIEAHQKRGKFATRLYGMLGGRYIEEAFVYSLPIPAGMETIGAS